MEHTRNKYISQLAKSPFRLVWKNKSLLRCHNHIRKHAIAVATFLSLIKLWFSWSLRWISEYNYFIPIYISKLRVRVNRLWTEVQILIRSLSRETFHSLAWSVGKNNDFMRWTIITCLYYGPIYNKNFTNKETTFHLQQSRECYKIKKSSICPWFWSFYYSPLSTLFLQAPIQKESSLLKEVSKIKLPKYLKNKRSMNTRSS